MPPAAVTATLKQCPHSTFTNMDSRQFAHTLIRPNRLLSAAEVLLSAGKRQILDITLMR